MKRNKKIVLLAHCFLNINAKVAGLATEPAGCAALVSELLSRGYGIIQLPCAEQRCFGVRRWGLVKEQLDFPAFRASCRRMLAPIVEQVLDFHKNGYTIAAVMGLDGSPTCGVNFCCGGDWGGEIGAGYGLEEKIASLRTIREPGVLMETLKEMFTENGLDIKFLAADETDPVSTVPDLIGQLE